MKSYMQVVRNGTMVQYDLWGVNSSVSSSFAPLYVSFRFLAPPDLADCELNIEVIHSSIIDLFAAAAYMNGGFSHVDHERDNHVSSMAPVQCPAHVS